jgi:hypothetical protein
MRVPLLTLAPLFLVACATTNGSNDKNMTPDGFIAELPEGVLAIVAPHQDLSAVKLDETGCYIYRYSGPVETTFLPLRARNGSPICSRPQGEPIVSGYLRPDAQLGAPSTTSGG